MRPCSASEAARRMLSLVGTGEYQLGTGTYQPHFIYDKTVYDLPWTVSEKTGRLGADCAIVFSWGYKLPRTLPGYNRNPKATVSDCLNANSCIEDARYTRDLFELVTTAPRVGDIAAYPTIHIKGADGQLHEFIGHSAMIVSAHRCLEWDPVYPNYSLLDIVQCCGPNGHTPGVIQSDGSVFDHHDHNWPKPEHRTVMLRAIP